MGSRSETFAESTFRAIKCGQNAGKIQTRLDLRRNWRRLRACRRHCRLPHDDDDGATPFGQPNATILDTQALSQHALAQGA